VQSGPEPQRLLTTLLGDYWYWRDEHIPSSTLVSLLGEFGISPVGAFGDEALGRLVAFSLFS
jgi:phenylacetic acid degradation operon negative regulatory protein